MTSSTGLEHDRLPVPVVVVDDTLTAIHVNRAWQSLSRKPLDGASWLAMFDPDERERVIGHLRAAMIGERRMAFEARGDADDQWLEIRVARADRPAALVVVVLDISAQHQREAMLAFQASRDPLTELYNRRSLLEHVQLALARLERRTSALAVAFIDLNRFKEVNDRYGHAAGDRVLVSIAERLRYATRPADTLARVGGDEFVAVCEDLDDDHNGLALAYRLAAKIAEPIRLPPTTVVRLNASVGIAVTRERAVEPSALLDRADLAMYEARRRGTTVHADTDPSGAIDRSRRSSRALDATVARLHQAPSHELADRPAGPDGNGERS